MKLSSSFEDSHVYVFRRSVLDLLHQKPHFSSLREEFLLWLCKIQYRHSKRLQYTQELNVKHESMSQSLSLKHSSLNLNNAHERDRSRISSPTNTDDLIQANLKIGVVLKKRGAESATRINTLHKFYEVNRRMLSTATYTLPVDPKNRSLIDQRAQISADSVVGQSTQISERTTIKRSVIGRHCTIGKMVKITGSVLLDHCIIDDGAKLDGCILGKGTQVGSKAELTRCVTQAGYEVVAGEMVKGEKLEVSDWMEAPADTPVTRNQELQAESKA